MSAAAPPPESAQLDCPSCRHSITYYDVAESSYYACPQCHAYFRYDNERPPKVYHHYQRVSPGRTLLPVGTQGVLRGQPCRIVGFSERAEAGHAGRLQYPWLEYQVYFPGTKEYAQLAVYDGHWTVVRPAGRGYLVHSKSTRHAHVPMPEATYKIYNRYQGRVVYAEGEFDWNIEGDDQTRVAEFIAPPVMLVQERKKDSETWYRAEHLEPYEVAAAFGIKVSQLPRREGVGAIQPAAVPAPLTAAALVVAGLLLLAQLLLVGLRPEKVVLDESLHIVADPASSPGTGKVIVSSPFTLDRPTALEIDIATTLSNQWLELPVSLVNEQTGQGFEFTKVMEYYSGVEGGESWSEGSPRDQATLSRVPAGRYHLNFYPITEAGPAPPDINVTVRANAALWSNFWITLALVLAYPAWKYYRKGAHEASRWENSDYGGLT